MSAHITRRVRDACLGVGSLSAVIAGAAGIDGTFRRYVFDAMDGQLPSLPFDFQIQHIARQVAGFAPGGNSSLFALAGAAVVLFVLMFRS